MDDVMTQLDGALDQIGRQGADGSRQRASQVDGALGGDAGGAGQGAADGGFAPAFVKAVGHHVAKAPGLYGVKGIPELFGNAHMTADGRVPDGRTLGVNLGSKKDFPHVSDDMRFLLLDLKKEMHNAELQRQILVHQQKAPIAITQTPYWKHRVEPKLKAYSLTDFSAWVPTLNFNFYFEELELDPIIDRFFPEVPMVSRTGTVPGATARTKGRLEADTATFTAQYNTSTSYSMTAQDCVNHTDITEDLMEDMVPQAGGFERLRREVAMGVNRSVEDAIINGDDSISSSVQGDGHMDSDVAGGAATLFNKAWKGLRKRGLAASLTYDNGGGGVALATYNGLLSLLGKFAVDVNDLLIIWGPAIRNKIIFGNVPEILTYQNYSGQATLLTGQLPAIFGIQPYVSEWVRQDVNSSGVYASASALTTGIVCRRSRFAIGNRAPMRVWATPSLASSDKMLLTAKRRVAFGGVPQSASEKSVAIATNIALT